MAVKSNFVLFERNVKVMYEDPQREEPGNEVGRPFTTFSYLTWFSKYFGQKGCAVRHLGIIIDLINYVFDDVTM